VIGKDEARKMRRVRLCGPRVLARLEAIGIRRLADLRGEDPEDLLEQVNVAAGAPIWRPPIALRALVNLVAAAKLEPR
jgi:hypothetical protein